jgi:hypothetical protein
MIGDFGRIVRPSHREKSRAVQGAYSRAMGGERVLVTGGSASGRLKR